MECSLSQKYFYIFVLLHNYQIYSRNSLPKINNGAYKLSLDGYKSIGTQRIALYENGNNKKKHDKIILLARTKLNTIEDLISRALIDPYICHNEVGLINNVPREYDDLKEANLMIWIKNLKTSSFYQGF